MEKLVRNEVNAHMTRSNLLSSLQHDLVHRRSCTTHLLEVLDKWTEALEQGDSVDAIYIDISKAFDTVQHQRLTLAGEGIGVTMDCSLLGFGLAVYVFSSIVANRRGRKEA